MSSSIMQIILEIPKEFCLRSFNKLQGNLFFFFEREEGGGGLFAPEIYLDFGL